jgi:hypothetical protein
MPGPEAGSPKPGATKKVTGGAGWLGACVQIFSSRFKAGPARQGLAAVADKPRRRASSRRSCRVSAGCRSRACAELNLAPLGSSCEREPLRVAQQVVSVSPCVSHSKLSPTTVLRPDRMHRAGQGPPLTSVAGLTEGGARRRLGVE